MRATPPAESLKSDSFSCDSIAQLFAATIVLKHRQQFGAFAVADAVDGVLAGDVLYLAAAKVEMAGHFFIALIRNKLFLDKIPA